MPKNDYASGYRAGVRRGLLLVQAYKAREPEQAPPPDNSPPTYPIPLLNGSIVRIAGLPLDLTEAEAKKIAAVVMALAVDDASGVTPSDGSKPE